ncbi:MAG: class I SAM-dependent methyltransferase [Cyanobacteria bacterium P01_A01_bin.84]
MDKYLYSFEKCPACNSRQSEVKHLFDTVLLGEICAVNKCSSCGLVYKEFAPTARGMEKIYSNDYVHFLDNSSVTDNLPEINSAKQKLQRCRNLLDNKKSPSQLKLLDIGCGSGSFVRIAQNLGYSAQGIDPYLPSELESSYLHKRSPESVDANSYDIAVLLNVAEHLDEPRKMFSSIYDLLKPTGVMLLTCPYGDSLARQIYRGAWGHLALEEHLLFWTPASLTHMLREIGFKGKVSYRIAGTPFPYGRIKQQVDIPSKSSQLNYSNQDKSQSCTTPDNAQKNDQKHHRRSFQSYIWQLARYTQRQEITANVIRSLMHLTHTGDYLEYAIKVE